jgi:hypothetical protein
VTLESLYVLGLVVASSLVVGVVARRVFRLRATALRPALVRLLEWAGFTVGFYVLNLLLGVLAVVVLRKVRGGFVSLYLNTDDTIVLLSALQAAVLQWWRAES